MQLKPPIKLSLYGTKLLKIDYLCCLIKIIFNEKIIKNSSPKKENIAEWPHLLITIVKRNIVNKEIL